jgi:hypothetical protein
VNRKLTSVIKGGVIMTSEVDFWSTHVTFEDGSTMNVKTAGSQPLSIPEGVQVPERSVLPVPRRDKGDQ